MEPVYSDVRLFILDSPYYTEYTFYIKLKVQRTNSRLHLHAAIAGLVSVCVCVRAVCAITPPTSNENEREKWSGNSGIVAVPSEIE